MSDKRFHVFVRRHEAGVLVEVLAHPHLAAFAADVDTARANLAHVLAKLLERGELWRETTWFPDARLKRVEFAIRAVQRGRLLTVPMRFSVLTFSTETADLQAFAATSIDAPIDAFGNAVANTRRASAKSTAQRGPIRVLVPRLDVSGQLADPDDLPLYVEELVRHALYLAPLERLVKLSYTGEETLDTLIVSARERDAVEPRKKTEAKVKRVPMPPALGEACRRLGDEATSGTLERAFRRETEMGLLENVVGARTRASALLVGAAAVGKTCLVHELAHRALDPESRVAGLEIYSTSGGRIVAGMRYLGQWQGRLGRMVGELRGRRAVLHIESLSELLSVSRTAGDAIDVARFLLPAVEAGEIALLVEATLDDVARAERSHPALIQAMRPIAVAPLGPAFAREALLAAGARIGRGQKVRFVDAALDRALDLTERFGEGALPGGAVDLLRAAAHEKEIAPISLATPLAASLATHSATSAATPSATAAAAPTLAAGGPALRSGTFAQGARGAARVIGADEVTAAFSRRTGYPRALVDPSVPLDPAAVLSHFRARVLGQDAAMALFANLVVTLKTNLADPARPLGSFLLLGPTGVGKTESALGLASYLFGDDKRLSRFDMAEYAAPGSAARLVASSGSESTLARRVREQPFGVVLLDEIEKADGSVHDLLLQILGEGHLTDGGGRRVSFRNTIVVLTSNLGADTAGRSLGFGGGGLAAEDAHYRAAAAAFFRPELLNRFDQIVPYRPLDASLIRVLARRMLESALRREGVSRRGVRIEWDESVVARLAELGFDSRLGARPLKRAVEQHVVAPLARLLARVARSSAASAVLLTVKDDGSITVAPID